MNVNVFSSRVDGALLTEPIGAASTASTRLHAFRRMLNDWSV